ncbi:MAG: N-6 DNA methylase [Bacteroidota bacterium]|nr:N-6 DNA methylase [Bacteroidota bacterium]
MKRIDDIKPLPNELPSSIADRLGVLYSSQTSEMHRKKYGQYFTPAEIARFMSSLADCRKSRIRILDPGCGTGVLSCALVEAMLVTTKNLSEIELVAYETDEQLISLSQKSFSYLKSWVGQQGVKLDFNLFGSDFILSNSDTLENQDRDVEYFDFVISNPPYFKLPKTDGRVKAANSIVHGQPNIYAIFLFTAAKLLEQDGQLIFITPRSFASGYYFRLFRDKFFSIVQLDTVHLFDSRKEAFQRDEVLQENVIISARRMKSNGKRPRVTVSISHGLKDLNQRQTRVFYLDELLDTNSYQKILHLPSSDAEAQVVRLFKSWQGSMNAYNIQISTGPVVSFRAKRFIRSQVKDGLSQAPLYWLHNASKMKLTWPLKKTGKGEYIQVSDQSLSLLIPNKNYIFLRRFSSKDDSSRLIATPYFADSVDADLIGVENHLNYIYRPSGHLDRNEILGFAALLNSTLFDTYFRTFNGNINVSATELREMPLPRLETIKQIGNTIIIKNNFSQSVVDDVIEQFFKLGKEFSTVYE